MAEEENDADVLEKRRRFFEERSAHCPETKLEMQEVGEKSSTNKNHKFVQVMEEIQREKEQAGKEERLEKKESRKLFMR